MLTAPLARLVVTIIGSISGVRPIATEIANSRACSQSCFVKPFIRKTIGTITHIKRIRRKLTELTPRSKLVGSRWPERALAMFPKYVLSPVARTTAVAEPLTTFVPMKQIFLRSNRLPSSAEPSVSANFSTIADSPVRADWLTNKSLAFRIRTSAGIISPAERTTISPGRRSAILISSLPFSLRTTVAVVFTSVCRPSASFPERNS